MKKRDLLFATMVVFLFMTGLSPQKKYADILNIKQRFVKVTDTLYADRYEVSVNDYRLFLEGMKYSGKDYSAWMYDSTCWRTLVGFDKGHVAYYYNHPAYIYYPIVGVPYAGAKEFCNWLTEKYNADPKRKWKKVLFRLPTEAEFVEAARGGLSQQIYPWGGSFLRNPNGCPLCNYRIIDESVIDYSDGELKYHHDPYGYMTNYTTPVQSYWPNGFGIYNISGNAAEMLQEEHIAMGGSWKSTGYNVRVTSKMHYEKPDNTVGFRVYMEIIERD